MAAFFGGVLTGETLRPLEPRGPLICPEVGCGGAVRIRSDEKLAEIRKKTAPDQELLQCERCSKLCAPRAFLRQELAQMWREAGLPDSPPNATEKEFAKLCCLNFGGPGVSPIPLAL